MTYTGRFNDDNCALLVGGILGMLLKSKSAGWWDHYTRFDVEPQQDEYGNWEPFIHIHTASGTFEIRITKLDAIEEEND